MGATGFDRQTLTGKEKGERNVETDEADGQDTPDTGQQPQQNPPPPGGGNGEGETPDPRNK